MYSDPFSITMPADVDNNNPVCVKGRHTLPSREEFAGRNIAMGHLVTKVLVSLESPLPPCHLWSGINSPVPRHLRAGARKVSTPSRGMRLNRFLWESLEQKNWGLLVPTNPVPVDLLRNWKRGHVRWESRRVIVEERKVDTVRSRSFSSSQCFKYVVFGVFVC